MARPRLHREELQLAGVHLLVALVLGVGAGLAWVAIARLPGIEGSSAFEMMLSAALWQGLALIAIAHLLTTASIGWLVGLGLALALLATTPLPESRRRLLLWLGPPLVGLLAMVVGLIVA